MPIGRITNRKNKEWVTQTRARRHRDNSTDHTTYIVAWRLHTPTGCRPNRLNARESKPTNHLLAAVEQFERRMEHAVFVELLRYGEDSITVVRRFCNLGRYRLIDPEVAWILNTVNPPYEIRDELREVT